ncbi:MAG: phosphoenolpyruvate synthase [Spirochaetales bacterium]|nr:phosphoenolpyruvate synthase [Spirochaetales bacterium]
MAKYIRFFEELRNEDVPLVGGKNASLGEMVSQLSSAGVRVPAGFATTADAYFHYLRENGLEKAIAAILDDLHPENVAELALAGQRIRNLVQGGRIPEDLAGEILAAYGSLSARYQESETDVAIRSSATAEDLPDASFAGQQESYLNVRGGHAVLDATKRCLASLFTDRAIAYRKSRGFSAQKIALSVGVQKMVRSDLAASGVMFTIDTESGFRDAILISSSYGLGENIVRGVVNPDEFYVFKPTLRTGHRPIIGKRIGSKELKMIYDLRGGLTTTRNIPVASGEQKLFSITDEDVLQLARWGAAIEEHYGRRAGHQAMDIEWGKDGRTGELYILQARPETVHSQRDYNVREVFRLEKRGPLLLTGRAVGSRIGAGPVRCVETAEDMRSFQEGEVLVTEMTDPDWVPVMRKAAAIITERGGRTCHAAIVSRELGLPAVVGTSGALATLKNGQEVTVSCAEGETGNVYGGRLSFKIEKISLSDFPAPRTRIMLNLADPQHAFELSGLPGSGVGLMRMEFVINNAIRIHPMALLRYPNLTDAKAVEQIREITAAYSDRAEFFVDTLSCGIGRIAAAFYPRDVILRMSDFKSNEYAGLIGGREFEPEEENPMIGFRGASRYDHPAYREGFALECQAVRRVRKDMGLSNLKVMIPFCRTVAEGESVIRLMAQHGLVPGDEGLEIYVMCEIPSNVILAREFARIFDGFSIGSNDLTQMTLGVDRDSEIVSHLFDEKNEAVRWMIRTAIQEVHAAGRKIGICGQAPSDYPDFAEYLVDLGIDSISLIPDTVIDTTLRIAQYEKRKGQ